MNRRLSFSAAVVLAATGAFAVAMIVFAPRARSAPLASARASLPPWTTDQILALRVVSDPQISPDGRTVAYVVSEPTADGAGTQTDVWLVPAAGGAPRRLTTSPVADEMPRWSPDGTTIAFLSDRPRPNAAKADPAGEGARQIWMIRRDGGEAWVASHSAGFIASFQWTPDGRSIAYLADEPASEARRRREQEKDDASSPRDRDVWDRLWIMDVASGKAVAITPGDRYVVDFAISPDGRKVAVTLQPTPKIDDQFRTDLWVVNANGGPLQPLVQRKGLDLSPAWSPDGKWIAFVSQEGANDDWFTNDFYCAVAAAGGAPRNLTRDFDELIAGLGSAPRGWLPDGRGLLFEATQGTATRIFRVDLDGRWSAVTRDDGVDQSPSVDARGATMAYLHEDATNPREVWVQPLAGGAPSRLTDTNPETREHPAFAKQIVHWKGADGWDIEGQLVMPPDVRAGRSVPLVLAIHGGPSGMFTNTCTAATRGYPWPQIAQKGWAILMPNPRGSGGYGEKFRAANRRDWGGKDYEDVMLGVDAMVERGIADPARLAVMGWSYGGFLTATIVTRTDRFRCAMVGAGVTDLGAMVGTSDIPEFDRSYFGAWPWEDASFYVDHSPLYHAGNVKTPTLVIHGEADGRVPTGQGWEFYTALQKTGVPSDLLLLPRSPHVPQEPKLLRALMDKHLEWLDRWAGPGAPRRTALPERPAAANLKATRN